MRMPWLGNLFAGGSQRRKAGRPSVWRQVEVLEFRVVLTTTYTAAWLGTLDAADTFSAAQGINDLGQVVGNSYTQDENGISTNEKAFLYTPDEGMVDLGTVASTGAFAWDISDTGLITGWIHQGGSLATGGYWEWAALWDSEGGYTIPGYAQPGMSSVAYGVNNNGIVVGNASVPGQVPSSGAYTFDGSTLTFLDSLGGMWSYGMDINNSNYVVGFADIGENPSGDPDVYMSLFHAVIWSPTGEVQDLGTLGTDSYAYQINESGQVVGSSLADDGFYHAFLYDGTQMIDIGQVGKNTQALAINDAGQVVGDAGKWLDSAAFLYEAGITYDLNDLVLDLGDDTIMSAHDINNLGQIVGYGLHNGQYEAVILTPTGLNDGGGSGGGGDTTASELTASISGPIDGFQGVTGQERTLTLTADGPLAADGFEFEIAWGDGTYDTINGTSGITASHVYTVAGSYTVSLTAIDSDGQTSAPATVELNIQRAELQGEVLALGGTEEDDLLTLAAGATSGTIVTTFGTFTTSQVMVYAYEGSDSIIVQGTDGNDIFGISPEGVDVNGVMVQGTSAEEWSAEGLAGDDTFSAIGTGMTVTLKGGDGNDRFRMAADSDLNVSIDGGAGSDLLDYAIYQNPVTVDLENQTATATAGFTKIEGFIGSNLVDTLIGANGDNTWTMGRVDSGTLNAVQFGSFENWIGGSGNDTFILSSLSGLYGVIDGGAGINTLDYSGYTTDVVVDLSAGTATTVRSGIVNIANVIGGAGADTLTGDGGDNILLGNAGDDVLIGGLGGNDVLVGGAGSDTLTGSAGRNILIGGLGADTIYGGVGEDILIGGTTKYDAHLAALTSLMNEWKRTDLTYQQRVNHLTGKTRGGANGTTYLTKKTVKDDGTLDQLFGEDGLDWFWGLVSETKDRATDERLN